MRDRTAEMRQGCEDEDDDDERVTLMGVGTPPRPPRARRPPAAYANAGAGVREALGTLELKLEQLEQRQEAALGTPLPPPELKRDLELLRDEIQELTGQIRSRLRALEPGQEDEEDENRNTIRARVKRTQHAALSQQFLRLTGRCHEAQSRYRQRNLERVRRQLLIAGSPPVSEEELEQMVESGQSEIFISNVLSSTRITRAALDELGLRHRELQGLEKGLRELGELFSILGSTLESQGEVIDRIERNIQDSGTQLHKGRQHLVVAQRSQQGARKKKLLMAACCHRHRRHHRRHRRRHRGNGVTQPGTGMNWG
ncbi:syntaxin-4 isoform X2 [Columba livia]|uniref:syntaxin-4 isoform X2 n=1 Tax=Columba livia TaxID=8932 RepID=UPI0031B9DB54